MLGRTASIALLIALGCAAPGRAAEPEQPVDIRPGSLATALQELAREGRLQLLFNRDALAGYQTPGLIGRFTPEQALAKLLEPTGYLARRSSSGAWIVEPRPPEPQPVPIPEILVIGVRTQNADIRRRESDVQPYHVTSGEQLVRAHRDDIGQYFASRITSNTLTVAPSQTDRGTTNSEIDLRGLGSANTVVLLDGRRLPSIPVSTFGFLQSDLNAVPLHAVERIETLTGTAGGIYGFGALGGVVNVVLKRDYRGAEFHVTGGITSRGDAQHLTAETRFGFTPDNGRTDVMIQLARSRFEPLHVGDRDFITRDRLRTQELVPERTPVTSSPIFSGNSLGIFSFSGSDLVLKPEFGGTSLSSDRSFLATGFRASDALASLARNAGRTDLSLNPGAARSEIGSHPAYDSVLVNVRHRFGGGIEGYADAVILRNHGRNTSHLSDATMLLLPDSPASPFEEPVWLTLPIPGRTVETDVRFNTSRYTLGALADLPGKWRATGEASLGSVLFSNRTSDRSLFTGPIFVGAPFGPDIAVLDGWDQLQGELAQFRASSFFRLKVRTRFQEQSLRLAGPVFRTAGGSASLTLAAERRREHVPGYKTSFRSVSSSDTVEFESDIAPRTSRTSSIHAELRLPLLPADTLFTPLRSLDVQLAARHDRLRADFARVPTEPEAGDRVHHLFTGTNFTAGARASPIRGVVLRASYATGEQPPPLEGLLATEQEDPFNFAQDPRRGNRFVFEDGSILLKGGGSPSLRTARAKTLALGVILTPLGERGPRLSLDYSRIKRTRDFFALDSSTVLAHEELWPERVTRDPLTDTDRALGFTGGRITAIDARATNAGGVTVEAVDGRARWPLQLAGGQLTLYADGTVQLSNKELPPFDTPIQRAGFFGGPVKWRANGGADWQRGSLSAGFNLQYFSRYRISSPGLPPGIEEGNRLLQGARWVSPQAYLDLYVAHRIHAPNGSARPAADIELAIVNLFDRLPPRESAFVTLGPGFSRYGDPRGRRIEISLSSSF